MGDFEPQPRVKVGFLSNFVQYFCRKIAVLREKLLKEKTTGRGGASWFCMADQIRTVVTRARFSAARWCCAWCLCITLARHMRRSRCQRHVRCQRRVFACGGCGANITCDSSTRANARGRAQTAGRAAASCRNTDRTRRRPRFQRECSRRRPKLYAHPFAHRFAQLNMGVARAS